MSNTPSNACPDSLLAAWLEIARRITGCRDDRTAIRHLESSAGLLSDTFTTGRESGFSSYRDNKKALAAYGLFFFPRTYVRTRMVMEECAAEWNANERPIRIVDVGAGTGAAGFAALQTLSTWMPNQQVHLDMVDCEMAGMDLARPVFNAGRELWPLASMKAVKANAQAYIPDAGVDLMLTSFAINEWMEDKTPDKLHDWVTGNLAALRPGGWMIIMEPALRTSVERMERLRDWIAAERIARILAPCPHHQPCPMLAEKRGWCHEVRTWKVPPSLRQINRALQRDVHLLKFSFLALQKAPAKASGWTRLVSPVKKENGKFSCFGCGADGHVRAIEWLNRHLTPEQKDQSNQLERGDRVDVPAGQLLGDGTTRRIDAPLRALRR